MSALWQKLPRRLRLVLAWVAIYFAMVGVGYIIQVPGSDWINYWKPRYALDSYVPWFRILLFLLPDLPFFSGLTLTALFFSLWTRKAQWFHILAAFSALPLFWTLWLGQVDAVPLLGLACLPWGIPIVLLKPQAAAWYVWVWWKKQPPQQRLWIVLGCLIFIGFTFLVWGFWPARFTTPTAFRTAYDLSLWRFHWALGGIFLLGALLETDPDRAMALGTLGAPYIQGAGYIVLLPVLTRLRGRSLFLVWLTTWGGVAALIFGDRGRLLALLFPVALWLALAWQARQARTVQERVTAYGTLA